MNQLNMEGVRPIALQLESWSSDELPQQSARTIVIAEQHCMEHLLRSRNGSGKEQR